MTVRNDEEKRSNVWNIVTTSATIIIIIVVVYFLFTLFAGNPLKGTWTGKDNAMQLSIHKGNSAVVSWTEIAETSNVKVKLDYVLDKENKTIAFKVNEKELEKTAKASNTGLTVEALRAEISVLETTFDYSLDNNKLTLAEREYGEKIVFVKK